MNTPAESFSFLDSGDSTDPYENAIMPEFDQSDPYNPKSLFYPDGTPIQEPEKWEKSSRRDKIRTYLGTTLGERALEILKDSNFGMWRRKIEGVLRGGLKDLSFKPLVTRDEIKELAVKGELPLSKSSPLNGLDYKMTS